MSFLLRSKAAGFMLAACFLSLPAFAKRAEDPEIVFSNDETTGPFLNAVISWDGHSSPYTLEIKDWNTSGTTIVSGPVRIHSTSFDITTSDAVYIFREKSKP